jgi:hypothetical protein
VATRRLRVLALLCAALYTFVVEANPVRHHDLVCHSKTPTHCEACAQSPVVSGTEAHFRLEQPALLDLGHVADRRGTAVHAQPVLPRSGRAPPLS